MKSIEFQTNTTINSPNTHAPSGFSDQVLTPDLEDRRLRFEEGETWIRILPALKGSAYPWMLPLQVHNSADGRFVHPRSITPNATNLYDKAYVYLKEKHQEQLFCKANREGIRLLTDSGLLCWVLTGDEVGKPVCRLLYGNGYDGSRGGNEGLGHQIRKLAVGNPRDGGLLAEGVDPVAGYQICVTRSKGTGSRYAAYSIKRGNKPAPVNEIISRMDDDEVKAIVPLEKAVRLLNAKEQMEWLSKCIPAPLVSEMQNAGVLPQD